MIGVAWKESESKEGLALISRVLEETSGWCFQAKQVEGVKYTLANGMTNMENNDQQNNTWYTAVDEPVDLML